MWQWEGTALMRPSGLSQSLAHSRCPSNPPTHGLLSHCSLAHCSSVWPAMFDDTWSSQWTSGPGWPPGGWTKTPSPRPMPWTLSLFPPPTSPRHSDPCLQVMLTVRSPTPADCKHHRPRVKIKWNHKSQNNKTQNFSRTCLVLV